MLSWWMGKSGERVQGEEPPETPAPVFAARALKSALFGTPARPEDDTIYNLEQECEIEVGRGRIPGANMMNPQHRSMSPTKPGILLTPGTAATRRKTVSFGNEVLDKPERRIGADAIMNPQSKSGIPDDCPGKFPSPWPAKEDKAATLRRTTSLSKILESSREGRSPKTAATEALNSNLPQAVAQADNILAAKSAPAKDYKRLEIRRTGAVAEAGPGPAITPTEPSTKSAPAKVLKRLEILRSATNKEAGSGTATTHIETHPEPSKTSSSSQAQPSQAQPPQAQPPQTSHKRSTKALDNSQEERQHLLAKSHSDGDRTVDLNQPHSQSGKFWKSEYESYHAEARAEMQRLMRYKQLANSYAKKKDDESADLAEKLESAEKKVQIMEAQIAQISTEIDLSTLQDGAPEPELVSELARRTALAAQYKGQVEEFREAMEEMGAAGIRKFKPSKESIVPPTNQDNVDISQWSPSKVQYPMAEMVKMREEMKALRSALSTSESKGRKLQDENTQLAEQLNLSKLQIEKQSDRWAKKRQHYENQITRRDEAVEKLQKDYQHMKNVAGKNKGDAEYLLKKRHDQVVKLREEISELKSRKKMDSVEHEERIEELQKQIQELKSQKPQLGDQVLGASGGYKAENYIPSYSELLQQQEQKSQLSIPMKSQPSPLDALSTPQSQSQIPILSRPSKAALVPTPRGRGERQAYSHTSNGSPKRPLSEIVNSTKPIDAVPTPRLGPVLHTPVPVTYGVSPLTSRFLNLSIETPGKNGVERSKAYGLGTGEKPQFELPSLEPSLNGDFGGWNPVNGNDTRGAHQRNCNLRASPRPKIFNIPSSPPKPALTRSRSQIGGVDKKVNWEAGTRRVRKEISGGDLRASKVVKREEGGVEGKGRRELPPERVAAAKARLEERKRRKAAEEGKENDGAVMV